jgi:hypothetical protein
VGERGCEGVFCLVSEGFVHVDMGNTIENSVS